MAPNMSERINRLEMLAIRYMSWTVESVAYDLESNGAYRMRSPAPTVWIRLLTDRVEHIAQYAIDGLSAQTRACGIRRDIVDLQRFLAEATQPDSGYVLRGYLPSAEDMEQIITDLQEVEASAPEDGVQQESAHDNV